MSPCHHKTGGRVYRCSRPQRAKVGRTLHKDWVMTAQVVVEVVGTFPDLDVMSIDVHMYVL